MQFYGMQSTSASLKSPGYMGTFGISPKSGYPFGSNRFEFGQKNFEEEINESMEKDNINNGEISSDD